MKDRNLHRSSLAGSLRPVRKRMMLFRLCRWTLFGLVGGGAAGALVLAASRLWPMLYAKPFFLAAVLAGLTIGFASGLWKRASYRDAAGLMDKSGTEDAVLTALDGMGKYGGEPSAEPVIVKLQREEAEAAAERYVSALRSKLPWPAWRSWRVPVYAGALVWLAIAVMLLLPNSLDEKAQAMAEARDQLKAVEEQIDQLVQEAKENGLPDDAASELVQTLEELRAQLASLDGDYADALKELEAAMRELERAADEAARTAEKLEAAARAMADMPDLRQLGEALQSRDAAAVSDAIDELRSRLRELSAEEREALAEALERLAADQPRSGGEPSELAEALADAAQQVRESEAESGEAPGSDALAELEEALANGLTQEMIEELARQMAERLAESGRQIAEQMAASGQTPPSGWAGGASGSGSGSDSGGQAGGGSTGAEGSGGGGDGSGSGSGAEPGDGSGGSQGEGAGTGAGEGSGEGEGAGAGSGTGSGSGSGAGAGSGSGTGSGSGSGTGGGQGGGAGMGAGGRGLVTTPRDMAGSGDMHQDGGPSTGGQVQTGGQSPAIDGMTRPYEEVYSEYAAEARRTLGRSQLPASMQEKIKQYFEEIQPE